MDYVVDVVTDRGDISLKIEGASDAGAASEAAIRRLREDGHADIQIRDVRDTQGGSPKGGRRTAVHPLILASVAVSTLSLTLTVAVMVRVYATHVGSMDYLSRVADLQNREHEKTLDILHREHEFRMAGLEREHDERMRKLEQQIIELNVRRADIGMPPLPLPRTTIYADGDY